MWHWIKGNAEPLEAIGTLLTALVAVVALLGVKLQLDENDRLQREQAARETYREFLKLGIERPDLSNADWCLLPDDDSRTAYASYVEYALYTAEQVISADPDWKQPMNTALQAHANYLCHKDDWESYSDDIQDLASDLDCRAARACR